MDGLCGLHKQGDDSRVHAASRKGYNDLSLRAAPHECDGPQNPGRLGLLS